MATPRQKTMLAAELGMFMLEEGKIFTGEEYKQLDQAPMRWATMRRLYGNWNRALNHLRQTQPDLWKELQALGDKKAPAPKPVPAPTIDLSAIKDLDEESNE